MSISGFRLNAQAHGGGCCGIKHLSGFPNLRHLSTVTTADRKEFIKDGISQCIASYNIQATGGIAVDGCDCSMCRNDRSAGVKTQEERRAEWESGINVVLNQHQIDEWRGPLEECGFKEVVSFKNDNSGNVCHVFYLITGNGEKK